MSSLCLPVCLSLCASFSLYLSVSVFLSLYFYPSLPSLFTLIKFDFPSRELSSCNNTVHLPVLKALLHIISFVYLISQHLCKVKA